MKIRITKGNGWYTDLVGEEFDVIRTRTNRQGYKEYIISEDREGNYNWVDDFDCEVIEPTE